jgi:hypothetical protein
MKVRVMRAFRDLRSRSLVDPLEGWCFRLAALFGCLAETIESLESCLESKGGWSMHFDQGTGELYKKGHAGFCFPYNPSFLQVPNTWACTGVHSARSHEHSY